MFVLAYRCAKVDPAVGPCECAVFRSLEVKTTDTPILKQNPMNVTCDETGQATCLKMCTALAQAAKARGPALLCATLQHVDGLMVNITPILLSDFTVINSNKSLLLNMYFYTRLI